MQDQDCLFCKIASGVIPAKIVYEDDRVMAFLDILPRAPGHTMVIPKQHAPTLLALPDDEVAPLFAAVKKVAALLAAALGPDGITIGINQGRASGQEVDHLHVHLMPRWHGDGGSSIQSVVHSGDRIPLAEVERKIKEAAAQHPS